MTSSRPIASRRAGPGAERKVGRPGDNIDRPIDHGEGALDQTVVVRRPDLPNGEARQHLQGRRNRSIFADLLPDHVADAGRGTALADVPLGQCGEVLDVAGADTEFLADVLKKLRPSRISRGLRNTGADEHCANAFVEGSWKILEKAISA